MKFRLVPLVCVLTFAPAAFAEELADPAEQKPVPLEQDLLGRHFQVGVSAAYALPFGRSSNEFARREISGNGGVFGADLNYGLDRFVLLGAYGEYGLFGSSDRCGEDCSAWSWGAGLQLSYHAAQGLRIDPWITYGLGWKQLQANEADTSYGAVEWMRLSLGADWYAASKFAFSPYGLFSAATTVTTPNDERAGGTDLRFQFGVRFLLDLPGRPR